jgi:hypothetical protein
LQDEGRDVLAAEAQEKIRVEDFPEMSQTLGLVEIRKRLSSRFATVVKV